MFTQAERQRISRILASEYRRNLVGYANEYAANTGAEIPLSELQQYIASAATQTLADPEFWDAAEEDAIETWEGDWFREFLHEYCKIYNDYPLVE